MNEFSEDKLKEYLMNVRKATLDERLNDSAIDNILKRVRGGSEITGLSFSELLQKLDFKKNDLSIEALESFLAELRAIFWLRDLNFSEITPLKAKKKTARPDFTAMCGSKIAAIEVFCLTQKHGQQRDDSLGVFKNFDPQFQGSKFGRDFMTVAQQKKGQLDSVSANIKVLLCVVNSESMVALNTEENWKKHAKLLYEKLSWGRGYYIGILAGSDATIYPKL